MNKLFAFACAAILLTGAGCAPATDDTGTPTETNPEIAGVIVVESLDENDVISSPVTVTGEAVGSWYFEASFPIRVLDEAGNTIGTGIAQAQGDWMTTEMVPFEAEISFDAGDSTEGTIVLMRDNPSGLPENDQSLEFDIKFE